MASTFDCSRENPPESTSPSTPWPVERAADLPLAASDVDTAVVLHRVAPRRLRTGHIGPAGSMDIGTAG
jgi:hypothetical protein